MNEGNAPDIGLSGNVQVLDRYIQFEIGSEQQASKVDVGETGNVCVGHSKNVGTVGKRKLKNVE